MIENAYRMPSFLVLLLPIEKISCVYVNYVSAFEIWHSVLHVPPHPPFTVISFDGTFKHVYGNRYNYVTCFNALRTYHRRTLFFPFHIKRSSAFRSELLWMNFRFFFFLNDTITSNNRIHWIVCQCYLILLKIIECLI